MEPSRTPWYSSGLAFECTRCGNCCTGAPGYVWVTATEIERLAQRLASTIGEFTRKYVRQVGEGYSLVERSNGDCIFWDRAVGCTIYEARPAQCRAWPFWPRNLETPEDWQRTQQTCPGAGKGPVVPLEVIEASAREAARALRR